MKEATQQNNKINKLGVYVGLAAIISGVCVGVIPLVGAFAPEAMSVTPWIIGALCAMGGALGYFTAQHD